MSARRSAFEVGLAGVVLSLLLLTSIAARAELQPPPGAIDPRVREVAYQPGEVYVLRAEVGYQLHLEFEPGESFVGLAAGDIEGVEFVPVGSHVFVKPKAAPLATNLTILTDRRTYHFDYAVAPPRRGSSHTRASVARPSRVAESIYSLRFVYAPPVISVAAPVVSAPPAVLNHRYRACGARALQPTRVHDDGVRTVLDFGTRQELPAVFMIASDGSEALVNFTVRGTEMIVHRVAERFVLRRGRAVACIENAAWPQRDTPRGGS